MQHPKLLSTQNDGPSGRVRDPKQTVEKEQATNAWCCKLPELFGSFTERSRAVDGSRSVGIDFCLIHFMYEISRIDNLSQGLLSRLASKMLAISRMTAVKQGDVPTRLTELLAKSKDPLTCNCCCHKLRNYIAECLQVLDREVPCAMQLKQVAHMLSAHAAWDMLGMCISRAPFQLRAQTPRF